MTSPTASIASLNGLHRLLRWPQQPDRPMQPLRLIIAPAGDEFLISSDTQTTTAPVDAHRLAQMLKYYPAPVRINGDWLERSAFPDRPRALEVGPSGGIAGQPWTAAQRRLPDSGAAGPLLRCQGLIYELLPGADARPDHKAGMSRENPLARTGAGLSPLEGRPPLPH